VRTLDALHLASALYLKDRGFAVAVATYDERFRDAAVALDLGLVPLD
jgi:predicted nucleic acid-binding protein